MWSQIKRDLRQDPGPTILVLAFIGIVTALALVCLSVAVRIAVDGLSAC